MKYFGILWMRNAFRGIQRVFKCIYDSFGPELNTFNDMFNFSNEHAFVKKIDFRILKGLKAASSGPRR